MSGVGDPLVSIRDLVKYFEVGSGVFSKLFKGEHAFVHAVDGVSLSILRNETFCIVGESGSGKTTLAMTILRLIEPTSGQILFENVDITKLVPKDLRSLRKDMQIVFQDPSSSLDPRKTVLSSISEPIRANEKIGKSEIRNRVGSVMKLVGLSESQIDYYPHQFSGGQRQRIAIARALILQPKLIVLDEPTSALDASVQSQILVLLEKLQSEMSLSYLLVTHNIAVARYLADRIAVMYLGKVVELGRNEDILGNPRHPYTSMLISSVVEPSENTRIPDVELEGEIPNSINPPTGCRFNTRCPYARELCQKSEPELVLISPEHLVACHFADEIALHN